MEAPRSVTRVISDRKPQAAFTPSLTPRVVGVATAPAFALRVQGFEMRAL
ncbi:hypothetical protein IG631_19264 [Alternaria alternata]|jgi:hypothetical protein|nr:hypothetical protein IG631_19264 [Alternaria alternata]